MRGAVLSNPHISSWHGPQLSKRDYFTGPSWKLNASKKTVVGKKRNKDEDEKELEWKSRKPIQIGKKERNMDEK
jgi:hypothetical protein